MNKLRSPIQTRCYRANSWIKRAQELKEKDEKDFDGRFIAYWIAFNSLYGQPKYHYRGETLKSPPEEENFQSFINHMIRLDSRSIHEGLRKRQGEVESILGEPFLCDWCWKYWDREKIVSEQQRLERGCNHRNNKGTELNQLFHRLYVLRNQLLHGCSTRRGSKNRKMLESSVHVLEALVPVFLKIVEGHSQDHSLIKVLRPLPYPPSV